MKQAASDKARVGLHSLPLLTGDGEYGPTCM